jgi:peptidoglycan/LPS O-acetylase OafA/YrhL
LALYTVFSFIFSIVCVYKIPKFAFYFPLCRFWQMAIGGLVAYFSLKIQNTKIVNALSIVGTSSILITVWIINEQSLFPGFWALIPTLASAAIIQAGSEPFINKHILSSKIFVFVGKISYPMYLWHWPLLVFSRYLYPPGSRSILSNIYFMIFLTVCLSIATYYLIENPIRKIKTKKIAIVLFVIIVLIGCLSYWTFIKERNKITDGYEKGDPNSMEYILAKAER